MIEELEKLLKDATPGPWTLDKTIFSGMAYIGETRGSLHDLEDGSLEVPDIELICLLRNNAEKILELLKLVKTHTEDYCSHSHDEEDGFDFCDCKPFIDTLKEMKS